MLTKLEDQILLTVWRMRGKAYGINIFQNLEERTGKKLAVGVVYFALDRLTKKGLLESRIDESTKPRTGRVRRYFRLTPEGMQQLRDARRNFHGLVEFRLGSRQERPDDAEHHDDQEDRAEQPLELALLAGVGAPWQFVFSVER